MKLFKRQTKPGAAYYCKFQIKGRQYLWSTKTPDAVVARRRATDYREAILCSEFALADKMKTRADVLTFDKIYEQYEWLPLKPNEVTRRRNVADMGKVLAASKYPADARLDVLSAKLAMTYQRASQEAGLANTTINSHLRNARSVFSKAALVGYKAFNLAIRREWVEDFCSVGALPEEEHLPEIPTPVQLVAAHTAMKDSPELLDVYRCFLLAAYAGLRAGEVQAARWDWIAEDVLYVGGKEFTAKSKKWRPIRLDAAVLELLQRGERHGPMIAGAYPYAANRHLTAVLRAAGFTSTKPTHSLRRLYGSHVAMADGLYAAQHALGHASPTTTSKHYARMLQLPGAVGIAPAIAPA